MKIEVKWKVTPKSGITTIEMDDLKCKNKKEWDALGEEEQNKRINEALVIYDGGSLQITAVGWWKL